MNSSEFLKKLQYNPFELLPEKWHDSHKSIKVPYKIYNSSYYNLDNVDPKSIHEVNKYIKPLNFLSHLCKYSYGIVSANWQVIDSKWISAENNIIRFYRRAIPSGGALYPNEIYFYIKGFSNLQNGIYHYNVPQHRLMFIKAGIYDDIILSNVKDIKINKQCLLGFISTVYWRNLFKYAYFSYRLQPQDTGVLLGQLSSIARHFGIQSKLYFESNELKIDSLLNLDPAYENIFALIDLNTEKLLKFKNDIDLIENISTNQRTLLHYEAKSISEFSQYSKMIYEAMRSTTPDKLITAGNSINNIKSVHQLPFVIIEDHNIIAISNNRCSPGNSFTAKPLSRVQLAKILYSSLYYFRITAQNSDHKLRDQYLIFISIKNIEGLADGSYYYNNDTHQLYLLRNGDTLKLLDKCMTRKNINIQNSSLCLHIAVNKSQLFSSARQYRKKLMYAGILYQCIQSTVNHLGCGAHILMSYDTANVEEIYKIENSNLTIISQIIIGYYKNLPRFTGKLP